jgi:hypothetical protein
MRMFRDRRIGVGCQDRKELGTVLAGDRTASRTDGELLFGPGVAGTYGIAEFGANERLRWQGSWQTLGSR